MDRENDRKSVYSTSRNVHLILILSLGCPILQKRINELFGFKRSNTSKYFKKLECEGVIKVIDYYPKPTFTRPYAKAYEFNCQGRYVHFLLNKVLLDYVSKTRKKEIEWRRNFIQSVLGSGFPIKEKYQRMYDPKLFDSMKQKSNVYNQGIPSLTKKIIESRLWGPIFLASIIKNVSLEEATLKVIYPKFLLSDDGRYTLEDRRKAVNLITKIESKGSFVRDCLHEIVTILFIENDREGLMQFLKNFGEKDKFIVSEEDMTPYLKIYDFLEPYRQERLETIQKLAKSTITRGESTIAHEKSR